MATNPLIDPRNKATVLVEPVHNENSLFDNIQSEDEGPAMNRWNKARQLEVPNEAEQIRQWAVKCNIPQGHLDKLLIISLWD